MHNSNKNNKRAAGLLDLLLDDTVDPATKEEIRAWLWSDVSRNAKEAAILERFRQMAPNPAPDESDRTKYAELAARLNIAGTAPEARKKRRLPLLRAPMRMAAAVALLLGISGAAYLWINRTATHPAVEVTESAGTSARSIQLPDGSSVELQAHSTLTYNKNFTSDRHIHLDGEALLTLKKSTDEAGEPIPFTVITDDLRVDIYGTAFRVIDPSDDNDGRSMVILYDGSVSVAANDAVVTLESGETYRYDHASQQPNIGLILAREMLEHGFMPLLRFEDSTLGNLVTSLTANYGVKFVMPEDIDLSKGKISGDFQAEDLKSTLNILTKSSQRLNFMLADNNVVVKRK